MLRNMLDTALVCLLVLGCVQVEVQSQSTQTLEFAIYYEVFCPACEYFITQQLYPTFQIYQDYLILDFVPYGFAHRQYVNGQWHFTCQHGPDECYGNKVQACAFALNVPISQRLQFIYCLENSGTQTELSTIQQCANDASLDGQEILDCATGVDGDTLLAANGDKTDALSPRNNCVPWFLFNGQYNRTLSEEAYTNFQQVVRNLLNLNN